MYRIQREILSIQQGNYNLVTYFNKLKKLWDDLNWLRPIPLCECGCCTCGLPKKFVEMDAYMKTIQFLMGLNEAFEMAKNQVLMQEPLSSVNRTYAMLQTVKSQKTVYKTFEDNAEASAMVIKMQSNNKNHMNKQGGRKKEKEDCFCEHCKVQGHVKDSCFKLTGYPDWYVDLLKTKNEKNGKDKTKTKVNVVETSKQDTTEDFKHRWVVDMTKQEIAKALKGTQL